MLLNNKADIKKETSHGNLPINYANNNIEIIQLLNCKNLNDNDNFSIGLFLILTNLKFIENKTSNDNDLMENNDALKFKTK